MRWWYWMLFGLIFLAADLITPGGFYLFFFGVGALVLGTIVGLDLIEMLWLQWLLFSVLSVMSLLLFRGPLMSRMKSIEGGAGRDVDTMVGEMAVLSEDLQPGATGKAQLRGSTWSVRHAGEAKLAKGQRARVERVEGLTLWIKSD